VITDFRGYQMDSATGVSIRRQLLGAAKAIPGVERAAFVNNHPFATNTAVLRVEGIDSVEALGRFNFQLASSEYFDVMRTRILRGRALLPTDRAGTPPIAIVSEAMGRALWPGRDPLGQCLHIGLGAKGDAKTAPCTMVVGIAENSAQQNLTDDPRYMYYLSADQWAPGLSTMVLRMSVPNAESEMERVRRELTRAMPGDGFVVVRPLQEVVDNQSRSWRLGATLFTALGALALVVAAIGLYGVINYNVAQRMHELGVRVALGAKASDVVALVVRQGLRFAVAGVVIGLAIAVFAARWVQPLLFRQSATDVTLYAVVGGVMVAIALVASGIPAMRAANADPNVALRSD
jgi:hypothetical protein